MGTVVKLRQANMAQSLPRVHVCAASERKSFAAANPGARCYSADGGLPSLDADVASWYADLVDRGVKQSATVLVDLHAPPAMSAKSQRTLIGWHPQMGIELVYLSDGPEPAVLVDNGVRFTISPPH